MAYMNRNQVEKLSPIVHCPTCGAAPGEQCELNSGFPRTTPHHDRGLNADYEKPVKRSSSSFKRPLGRRFVTFMPQSDN